VLVDIALPTKDELKQHGIFPRKKKGLLGIFAAPFLNDGIYSMITNTLGILAFGLLLLRRSLFDFIIVTVICVPLAGLISWIVNPSYAVGSGGLICAWFGYLVAIPFFVKPIKFGDLMVAVGCGVIYIIILIFMPGTNTLGNWVYNLSGLLPGFLLSVLKHGVLRKTSQHWESLIDPSSTSSSQPSDTTRLLETPVANKGGPNSNPFE